MYLRCCASKHCHGILSIQCLALSTVESFQVALAQSNSYPSLCAIFCVCLFLPVAGLQGLWEDYASGSEERRMFLEKRYGKHILNTVVEESLSEGWKGQNSKECPSCRANIQVSLSSITSLLYLWHGMAWHHPRNQCLSSHYRRTVAVTRWPVSPVVSTSAGCALVSWTKITLTSTMKTLTLPAIMPHLTDRKVVLLFDNPVHVILQLKFRSNHIYSQCYQITTWAF